MKERRKGQWIFYSLEEKNSYYPIIESLLKHVPSQREKLDQLEACGLRIIQCD